MQPHPDSRHAPVSSSPEVPRAQPAHPSVGIPAQQLFKGSQEVLIVHKGEAYRLRITKNDKLILTK